MRINLCTSVKHYKILLVWCLLLYGMATQAQVTISGRITFWADGTPLSGVPVFVTGTVNEMVLTDANGEYHITVPSGTSCSVRPFANAYPNNGITTYDGVQLDRHLMALDTLPPYALIAADVDDSYEFSNDRQLMTQLMLGVISEFPDGESWRFVRSDYIFPDPLNPFPFPRTFDISNITSDQAHINFRGIKLGDINGGCSTDLGFLSGDYLFARVVGKVLRDENDNCAHDTLETPLKAWKVIASGAAGNFFAITRPDGSYNLRVPAGTFEVSVVAPNDLWSVCTPVQNIDVSLDDTVTIPFSVQAAILCPRLGVNLGTGWLRRCFSGTYIVQYSNDGTQTAENAYLEVELDPYLSYTGSSIPGTLVSGNTYSFQLGNLEPGTDRSFTINVDVSCEAELGQTHCSTAHIFPDSICGPDGLWNGPDLKVTAACTGDNVEFTVINEGADMDEPAAYVIIEDIMIQMHGDQLQLDQDESETFTVPANGSTWRLEVNQSNGYPWSLISSAMVEGCGTNTGGTASQGIVVLFPQDDDAIFEDQDCTENIGSFDPNDKQGFPAGISVEHFIPKGEEIEYRIRFQNTGTDTAFTVMILDTISSQMDLTTLRTGASSHPYTFNLYGQGVAQFVFSNIMLPDSNVNEAASHGFVKFTISPKADLPDGTQLENQAGIYFDFNEPVITNRTLHTIGEPEQYLEVTQVSSLQAGFDLSVFPNPARTEAIFSLKTAESLEGEVLLYNIQGQQVKRLQFSNNTFKVNVADLASGHYMFLVKTGGRAVSSGKILVENGK